MQIALRIIGGAAGPARPEERIDLDSLPGPAATRLRQLVADAHFFSLDTRYRKSAPQSFDFVHEMTVQDGERTYTIRYDPEAAPAPLRALDDAVVQMRGITLP